MFVVQVSLKTSHFEAYHFKNTFICTLYNKDTETQQLMRIAHWPEFGISKVFFVAISTDQL